MSPTAVRRRPALDPRLQCYIDAVRRIAGEPLSDAGRLRRVRRAAEELASAPVMLDPADRRVPAQGYGRNLLHRDPEHGFVVIAMVWPAGTGGLPHDHGTWGVVAVTEGLVEVTNYVREDDGSDPARAGLVPLATIHAKPGSVAYVLPPHEDFHSVRNAMDHGVAVTIHTYGQEPVDYHTVETGSGRVTLGRLEYHNR